MTRFAVEAELSSGDLADLIRMLRWHRLVPVATRSSLLPRGPSSRTGSTDLATLQSSWSTLSAAQSMAERADKLLEWPIDERMVTWMTVVVTGVVTSLIVRFVLEGVRRLRRHPTSDGAVGTGRCVPMDLGLAPRTTFNGGPAGAPCGLDGIPSQTRGRFACPS
jgi:hypothetical protein